MKILSFNITHDSSVCCIENGTVTFFCKEERLTGVKRDKHPFRSLQKFYEINNNAKIDYCLFHTPTNSGVEEYSYGAYNYKFFNCEMENYSSLLHHDCHANLAYYNSCFEEALIFVIDRNGSVYYIEGNQAARESESVYIGSKNKGVNPIYKNFWMYGSENIKNVIENTIKQSYNCEISAKSSFGIVTTYEAATTLIGQDPIENGKTMGLSSYCSKEKFDPIFKNGIADSRMLVSDVGTYLENQKQYLGNCFYGLEHMITESVDKSNYEFYAEKAKHVQVETQNAALQLIKKYSEKTGIKNICLVGGYALNVVANNFYIKNLPHLNFYFEPVADDTGIPIGAAMKKYFDVTNESPNPIKTNFYHYYKEEPITEGQISSVDEVCTLLCDKKSVAIFEGSPEAGPRALGHRSILFDPRNVDCKEIVNRIKNREWYRPFAGVILEHRFSEYFETLGLEKSEAMTINFDAKEHTKKYVPGIIHVDGTCRIQTVSSGFLYDLLKEFERRTGCPMLLNTSFNLAGNPLVQTKEDALYTLNNSELDAVYFVDYNRLVK